MSTCKFSSQGPKQSHYTSKLLLKRNFLCRLSLSEFNELFRIILKHVFFFNYRSVEMDDNFLNVVLNEEEIEIPFELIENVSFCIKAGNRTSILCHVLNVHKYHAIFNRRLKKCKCC